MKRKFNKFMRFLKNNPRGLLFYIVFIVFLGFLGFYVYCRFVQQPMLESDISSKASQTDEITQQITEITGEANYQKYSAAKYIQSTVKITSWSNTMASLVSVFDNVKSYTKDDLQLSDFQIDLNEIKMKGQTKTLSLIYGDGFTGGIISQMEKLDFIDMIDIPSYNKSEGEDFYDFNLDAKIKLNDGKLNSAATGSQDNVGK